MTPTPRVLLAEDDDSDVLFLRRAFRKAELSFPIEAVGTGSQAIDYLSGVPPFEDRSRYPAPTHLVLDLKMPEKSGFEVLEWIRAEKGLCALPVAILTSSSQPSDIRRSRELGANCYFIKPMGFDALLPIVRLIGAWMTAGLAPEAGAWPLDEPSSTPRSK